MLAPELSGGIGQQCFNYFHFHIQETMYWKIQIYKTKKKKKKVTNACWIMCKDINLNYSNLIISPEMLGQLYPGLAKFSGVMSRQIWILGFGEKFQKP